LAPFQLRNAQTASTGSSRMSCKCGAGCQIDNEDVQEKLLSFTNPNV
jgi:hypothetical protein